jgi:hypothetical protein
VSAEAVQAALFDVTPAPRPDPGPPVSATVRRTRRQAAMLTRGVHPLAPPLGYPLRLHAEAAPTDGRGAPGRRCGNCRFREVLGHHDRSYAKCLAPGLLSAEAYKRLGPPRVSHSAATDVRAWWPACTDHDWGDGQLSPDAARSIPGVTA